jgi:hypothetical protein
MGLVDQLGSLLALGLAEKRSAGEGGTGELLLQFMIAKAEMGGGCVTGICANSTSTAGSRASAR